MCEGLHFLNGVRRRGQQVPGWEQILRFQSPRLHKGVAQYDSGIDLAPTLRLVKKSKARQYMAPDRPSRRGKEGHPQSPEGTLPRWARSEMMSRFSQSFRPAET